MRAIPILTAISVSALAAILVASHHRPQILPDVPRADGSVLLPNGWTIKAAGKAIPLAGDMPVKMQFTADGKRLLVVYSGWHNQGMSAIDPSTDAVTDVVSLSNTFGGFGVDGNTAYVSGGRSALRVVSLDGALKRVDDFGSAPKPGKGKKSRGAAYTAGVVANNGFVWVVNTNGDSVAQYSAATKELRAETKVGYRPYAMALSPDAKTLAVGNWGDSSVSLIDATSMKVTATVKVGEHPTDLIFAADGRLFVANAGSNTVSVIKDGQEVEAIRTSLDPKDLVGSTPDALALTPDGKTLFVANAGNNDVAVVNVESNVSHVQGFIPTGWYPSALAVSPDGQKLYIGTGKGNGFSANYPAKTSFQQVNDANGSKFDYIGGVLSGNVHVVPVPSAGQLAKYTHQVAANIPKPHWSMGDPIPTTLNKNIKHVVYIIRENRTYDQVFGDMPEGNGEPKLTLFGETVTPNAHQLAKEFTLFDNLYCDGEVSEDGHQWCDAAYATVFTEHAWINSYSARSEPDGDERVTASPAGYLWDNCRRHGLSYISYGESSSFHSTPDSPPTFEGASGLKDHASQAWSVGLQVPDGDRDYKRVDIFLNDLKQAEQSGNWPNFMVMSLGEDHTHGMNPNSFSPEAAVASNDLGLGKIVDAISHSKFWKDTAIFVIEDDAQNGPDHVDAHRTVGLVISPYTRRHNVDSTHYTTSSYVRTMESMLGLPPMTQFDENATPCFASFSATPNYKPYTVQDARIALNTKNPERTALGNLSKKLDWTGYDKADPNVLNAILWKALKPNVPMPAPVRSISAP